jgi:hypothetical protein
MRALLVAVVALAGCMPALPASYSCTTDAQCVFRGGRGVCEPSGACSFADASCASGRRYGDFAPPGLADQCVDSAPVDLGGGGGAGGSDGGTSGGIVRVGSSSLPASAPANMLAVVPAPAALHAGDLLFACVFANDHNATIAAGGSGWTQHLTLTGGVTASFRASWFYRFVAASNEPSAYSFTVGGSPAQVAGAVVAYRGVATPPVDDASNQSFDGTGPFTAPSITTTHAGDMLLALFVAAAQTAPSWTPPAGMQTAVDDHTIAGFDALQAAAGASGDKVPNASLGVPGIGAVDFVALTPAQ